MPPVRIEIVVFVAFRIQLTMAELNKRTSAVNGIKRHATKIMHKGYGADEFELHEEQKSLNMHFTRFTEAHDALIQTAEEGELEPHEELWQSTEDLYTEAMAKTHRMMAALAQHEEQMHLQRQQDEASSQNSARVTLDMGLKLDRLKVPTFDGTLYGWLAFKDAFETLVHNTEAPEAYKLAKLREAVQGDAKALVGGMYTGGYNEVWQALQERYDSPKQLAEIHVARFIGLKQNAIEMTSGLLSVVDTVRESFRALAVMELPVDQWDALAVPIVASKLPAATQQAWGMSLTTQDIPKLDELLSFVEKRAHSISSGVINWPGISTAPSSTHQGKRTSSGSSSNPRLVKTNLATTAPGNCSFCNEGMHRISYCSRLLAMPVNERFNQLKGSNLCFNCLQPGHGSKDCPSTNCRKCNGRHHTLLCRTATTTKVQASTQTETSTTNTVTQTQAKATLASSGPPRNL